MQKDVRQKIQERMLGLMLQGENPFKVPFTTREEGTIYDSEHYPMNYLTNKIYQGVNQIAIPAGYYLTFKQVESLGGKVKKDAKHFKGCYQSKSEKVVTDEEFEKFVKPQLDKNPDLTSFWTKYSRFYKDEETGAWKKSTPFWIEFQVFNIKDCENLPVLRTEEEENLKFENPKAKEVLDSYGEKQNFFYESGNEPAVDFENYTITLPVRERYNCDEDFYLVAFDTVSHSTAKELGRETGRYGGQTYSKEMLVNQITAILCLATCGLANNKESLINSGAYMKEWASLIQGANLEDKVFNAVEKAIKSYNLIFKGKKAL